MSRRYHGPGPGPGPESFGADLSRLSLRSDKKKGGGHEEVSARQDDDRPSWTTWATRKALGSSQQALKELLDTLFTAINDVDVNKVEALVQDPRFPLVINRLNANITVDGRDIIFVDGRDTVLTLCARRGYQGLQIRIMKMLLGVPGIDTDGVEAQGYTALMIAAMGGYSSMCTLLLDDGADWSYAHNELFKTAKDFAEDSGHNNVVDLIDRFVASSETGNVDTSSLQDELDEATSRLARANAELVMLQEAFQQSEAECTRAREQLEGDLKDAEADQQDSAQKAAEAIELNEELKSNIKRLESDVEKLENKERECSERLSKAKNPENASKKLDLLENREKDPENPNIKRLESDVEKLENKERAEKFYPYRRAREQRSPPRDLLD